jgi:RNA polymerase sigma-70 factor (ECF subfamily)
MTSVAIEQGFRTADETCLEAFESEFDYAHRTLLRLGVPGADVEDLLQELFLVLRRSWAGFDESRPLRPYLFGIAYRIASAHRRKRKRERDPVPERADLRPNPEEELQTKQTRRFVLAALAKIPLQRRAVLMMHDIDGVAIRDVAASLKIPRFTAYSRLAKARRELRDIVRRTAVR